MGCIYNHEGLIKNSLPSNTIALLSAFVLIRHVTEELIAVDSNDVETRVFQNSKPNNDCLWAIGSLGVSERSLVINWGFVDVIAY